MLHRNHLPHSVYFKYRLLPALVLFISSLVTAFGQSATATLSGEVVDQNGAVVPNAEVTVTNNGTGQARHATTNDSGNFTVPLLPPGAYTVSAQREGFAPVRIPEVILNVGDQKSLPIQLRAGSISEMVQVIGEAPLINESPAVGTVVDRQFVESMPLNGRSFQSLITLMPGVVLAKTNVQEQGQFSVNGQRSNANYFTVDGVSANFGVAPTGVNQNGGGSVPALSAAGGTNSLVSVDAMQEFKIQTSTYAAEFGRTPGAQVQILPDPARMNFTVRSSITFGTIYSTQMIGLRMLIVLRSPRSGKTTLALFLEVRYCSRGSAKAVNLGTMEKIEPSFLSPMKAYVSGSLKWVPRSYLL